MSHRASAGPPSCRPASTGQLAQIKVTRLAWAGIEIRLGGTRLLIDPLEHAAPMVSELGEPRRLLPEVDLTLGTDVLITHLHPDHYDRELLRRLRPPGTVGCHVPAGPTLVADGIAAVTQELEQPRRIGPLTVTPVPAMDWRGDDQVSWVVEGGGRRIFHGGDTMWHGYWWRIAQAHGPFDVVFLPVNGVVARFGGLDAKVPVTLTPEGAIEAAVALGARSVCAIHYGLFNNPPYYVEQLDIEARFRRAAQDRDLTGLLVAAGDIVPLASPVGRSTA